MPVPAENDPSMRGRAVRVIAIEVLVVAGLWLLGRVFGS
jgi:hypothetical protein